MADFTYRGIAVEDTWPSGARRPGSQTRFLSHRREDGSQRWRFRLPVGQDFLAYTQEEARRVIRLLAQS